MQLTKGKFWVLADGRKDLLGSDSDLVSKVAKPSPTERDGPA
jgi:hypothetical protein